MDKNQTYKAMQRARLRSSSAGPEEVEDGMTLSRAWKLAADDDSLKSSDWRLSPLALYCATDPFKHSAISEFPDFKTYKVDLSPWSDLPTEKDHENLLQKSEIKFLNQVQGPESIVFDTLGRGPYTGVADGRVCSGMVGFGPISPTLRPIGRKGGRKERTEGISQEILRPMDLGEMRKKWIGRGISNNNNNNKAYTILISKYGEIRTRERSEICDPKPSKPSPLSYIANEHICGRPLGLRFNKKTGELYIADAYLGLLKVGPEGGLATQLTTEAEGVPLGFTNDLDIDEEGHVYFTDSSNVYRRRNFLQLVFSGENSGRILKYNPETKETRVLVRNIQFPNGLSLSKDGSFFLFCEGLLGSLRRYWLKGEKAGTSEVFAILPGFPDNVRTNEKGEFWVAIHCRKTISSCIYALYPKLRKFLLKLPVSAKMQYLIHIGGWPHGIIARYSPEGKLLQILEDSQGKVVKAISEVEEKDGKLWMGSVLMPFMAVYNLA